MVDEYFLGRYINSLEFRTRNRINLGKLDECIKHLMRYDKIVGNINTKSRYKYDNDFEVIKIPEGFSWEDLVSTSELNYFIEEKSNASVMKKSASKKGNKTTYSGDAVTYATETTIKRYRRSYKEAVNLIMNSSDLIGVTPHQINNPFSRLGSISPLKIPTYKVTW